MLDRSRERGDIISFGGGAPSLPPPLGLLNEFNRLLKEDALRSFAYTGTRGIPALREAIANDVKKYGDVDFDPFTEIIITTGATESIFSSLMCLIDPGDEVIISNPTYLGYKEMIELAGGRAKTISVGVENNYQPAAEQLKDVISSKTKAVILLSPDNPTGRIIDESFVKALVNLAEENDFWIVSDDIYKHIIYEGNHVWVSRYSGAKEHTITVCSFSKEAGMPGMRLGYTLAPKPVIESIEKIQQYSTLAPESLGQFALVTFLNENMKEPYLRDSVKAYVQKRDFMGRMIQKHLPQARTTNPAGAYYFFVDIRPYLTRINRTEEDFAETLLAQRSVALIPGRFFGENGKGHVRLTFVTEPEIRIEEGIQRIGQHLHRD